MRGAENKRRFGTLSGKGVLVYFLTVFSTIYLVIYPLAQAAAKADEYTTRLAFVADAIRLIGQVLPGFLSPWIDGYARDPSHFLIIATLVGFLIWLGSNLGDQIQSRMQAVWRPSSSTPVQGKTWKYLYIISSILAAGAVLYPLVHFAGITPPPLLDAWLQDYATTWIRITLAMLLIALLLPNSAIQWLRTRQVYKNTVRFLKLGACPGSYCTLPCPCRAGFREPVCFQPRRGCGTNVHRRALLSQICERKSSLRRWSTTMES